MKINGADIKDVLLSLSLEQFRNVPPEEEIDHTFSESFEENIQRINKKSQSALWRFWQSPWKRWAIIGLILAFLATMTMVFRSGFGTEKRHIPQITETYYIPTYEPDGFILSSRERYISGVSYIWQRNQDMIRYIQTPGFKDTSELDFEGCLRTGKIINGRTVEFITHKEGNIFIAIWYDERYTYWITINVEEDDPYAIVDDLIDSLVLVNGKDKPAKLKRKNTQYSICEKDGKHVLVFDAPITYASSCCVALRCPSFTSIAEMRQGIISGPLTEHEISSLYYLSKNAEDEIMICDPDKLYECTAPTEFDLEYISWEGTEYLFSLESKTSHGYISCMDEEDYANSFKYGYKDFLTNSLVTVTDQTSTLDRFATVYYCSTRVAKLKFVCYEISVGGETMYVQEEYLLENEDSDLPVSDTVPSNIQFWGTENGGYFDGYLSDLTERPSIEWLSQFGLINAL